MNVSRHTHTRVSMRHTMHKASQAMHKQIPACSQVDVSDRGVHKHASAKHALVEGMWGGFNIEAIWLDAGAYLPS